MHIALENSQHFYARSYLKYVVSSLLGTSMNSLVLRRASMTFDAAFTHFPTLTTNRLHLRQIKPEDAEALFAILSDQRVTEFYGHEPHQSLNDTRELIRQIQARYERREALRWGITFRGEDRLIGSCSLHHVDAGSHRAETGYELHHTFWSKGIMTEAMSAILTYGFTDLELHRIEAIIDIANDRSKILLLKLGFTYEGNLRQRYFFRDRFEDEHYFGLIKAEWRGSV
jgi:ribosomal-protein-alanine N-acetyltransferase